MSGATLEAAKSRNTGVLYVRRMREPLLRALSLAAELKGMSREEHVRRTLEASVIAEFEAAQAAGEREAAT